MLQVTGQQHHTERTRAGKKSNYPQQTEAGGDKSNQAEAYNKSSLTKSEAVKRDNAQG
jgi:hypothetical protein